MITLERKIKLLLLSFSLLLLICFLVIERAPENRITIGAKNNTSQNLLAEILAQLIEEKTDLRVKRQFVLEGTYITFRALKAGSIDLYFEYTGTALLEILRETSFPEDMYGYLKQVFDERFDIVWLDRIGLSDKYCLITRRDSELQRLSDLANQSDLTFAFTPEFLTRIDYQFLDHTYRGEKEWKPKMMGKVLLYFSLLHGEVDVIVGSFSDGRLRAGHFRVLEDDLHCLPAYEAAPLIRKEVLKKHPELEEICQLLAGKLTVEKMRELNYTIEFEGKDIPTVAAEFIAQM